MRTGKLGMVLGISAAMVGIGLAASPARAASIAITNNTGETFNLYDLTTSTSVDNLAPGVDSETLADTDEYDINSYSNATFYGHASGHTFHIAGGDIVADNYLNQAATMGITDQFFQVTGPTDLALNGKTLTFQQISQGPPGGYGSPAGTADYLIGYDFASYIYLDPPYSIPPYTLAYAPADGMFSGIIDLNFVGGADTATLYSGIGGGIVNVVPDGVGGSWAPLGPTSGILTLPSSEQIFISFEAPEPASMILLAAGGLLLLKRRRSGSVV